MIFAIGFILALAGFWAWRLDVENPPLKQLRRDSLGRIIAMPRWWGYTGFFAMLVGIGMVLSSLGAVAWRWLP